MMYPLVVDLAAEGVAVVTSCRVLGFSTQAFYKWRRWPGRTRSGMTHICSTSSSICMLMIPSSGIGSCMTNEGKLRNRPSTRYCRHVEAFTKKARLR